LTLGGRSDVKRNTPSVGILGGLVFSGDGR
jgi:hypothetical protein